jgi:drug/metabolite transporter (DMT)-like permease
MSCACALKFNLSLSHYLQDALNLKEIKQSLRVKTNLIKMEWYIFALLAPAFWALNNIFIKFLITKKFKSYFPMIISIIIMDSLFALAILVVAPITFQFPYTFYALAVGLMPLLAFWFYSKALLVEEVTRIITLFQLIPVFVVLLSAFFLNEILIPQEYLGIAIIVIASTLISYKKTKQEKMFSSAFKFMIPFGVIIATYTILEKYLLSYFDMWSLFFWNVAGAFLGVTVLLYFAKPRREFTHTITTVGKRGLFLTFVGEGMYVIGAIFSLLALSSVDASIASALFGLQPFFIFFYMLFVSLFLPKILKEELTKQVIVLKICAIALVFTGTYLIV